MSVNIEVYRGAGDLPGAEIIEPLLGDSLAAAMFRCRNELDDKAHAKQTVDLLLVYRNDLELGFLVRVADAEEGVEWCGQITAINHQHTITPPKSTTTITVIRCMNAATPIT